MKLNNDDKIHGIMIEMPLPKHLHPYSIFSTINPIKDVDGLTAYNIGALTQYGHYKDESHFISDLVLFNIIRIFIFLVHHYRVYI